MLHWEVIMGQLIEFYVPYSFHFPQRKWIPESERGKVLSFRQGGDRRTA
jgi:hypothetical protein